MAKVRSEYIKKLMTESHDLEGKLKEAAQSTINTILEEKTNENLRKILSESADSFSEEEVDNDTPLGDTENPNDKEGDGKDGADDGEWDDLEQYKDEDGEYDLRSIGKDELVKILKAMTPDDEVRIFKNDDDSVTVTDDDEEYELVLDGEDDDEEDELECEVITDDDTPEDDEEDEFEIEDEDEWDDEEPEENEWSDDEEDEPEEDNIEIELDESDLGYTDNYQKQTAMTTPDNHEPANPRSTYSMDGGVPTGTKKPWVGGTKKAPYDDEINEEEEAECGGPSLQEGGQFGKVAARVAGKQRRNNSSGQGGQPYGGRHLSIAGEYQDYEPSVTENIKKKANEIFVENKQLRKLMGTLHQRVNEAIVVNQSLANLVRLINENSTTAEEKKEFLQRFNQCGTREESNKLYTTISEELRRKNKTRLDVAGTLNSQLSESREKAVETPMYQSQDLSDTLNFMKRLDAIK